MFPLPYLRRDPNSCQAELPRCSVWDRKRKTRNRRQKRSPSPSILPRGEETGAREMAYTLLVRLALLVLLPALVADDDRANRFFDRVRFEKPEARDEEGRRVLEIFLKKEHWVGAYRTLEERFGKFPDDLEVAVDFKLEG